MIEEEKYEFKKYDRKYENQFRVEKKLIQKAIKNATIEHVGSSAVPGLGGKGIIDIGIGVKKSDILHSKNKLEKIGFEFRPNGGDKNRLFFRKIIKYAGKERRIHIQLVEINGKSWEEMLKFRDYLRNNKGVQEEYAKVKKEGSTYAKGEGEKYRQYKKEFVDALVKEAMKK
ncbi:GrpB family protein [Candidatus Woesearchaeota archaeon]|nr:GrpB family protein [Candidatus Woesearchaeota archaeon]